MKLTIKTATITKINIWFAWLSRILRIAKIIIFIIDEIEMAKNVFRYVMLIIVPGKNGTRIEKAYTIIERNITIKRGILLNWEPIAIKKVTRYVYILISFCGWGKIDWSDVGRKISETQIRVLKIK